MIRRHIVALRMSLMAADALTAMGLFAVVSILRFGPAWPGVWDRIGLPAPLGMAAWGAAWVLVLLLHGLYRPRARWSARAEAADVVRALLLVAVFVFVALFMLKLPEVSRLFLVALFGAQLAVTLVSRLVIRQLFSSARARGLNTRYVLVAGTSPAAQAFADWIERHEELGLRVIGHLGRGGDARPHPRHPVLGDLEDLEAVLHRRVVDEVAICLRVADWPLVEAITRICAEEGKIVRVPGDEGTPRLAGAAVEHFDGLTIQSLLYGPDRALGLGLKRLIDIAVASLAMLAISPILLVVAVAIRVRDGGPILFRQTRVGLHGRTFGVVKFRTMVVDAEGQLEALRRRNEIAGHAFKISDDPRITATGRLLRRTSIDELPQLWNVLRGEMSLVGPRPPLPAEVAGYDLWHRRRLSMKPGITGLWQVSDRRSPDFDRWVTIDLDYIDRWSLWLDLKILARTLPAMLTGR